MEWSDDRWNGVMVMSDGMELSQMEWSDIRWNGVMLDGTE